MAAPTDAQLLARLGKLAPQIVKVEEKRDALYAERLAIWQELIDRRLPRQQIADASNVSRSAVNVKMATLERSQAQTG